MPVVRVVVASGAVIIPRRAVGVRRRIRLHVGAIAAGIAARRVAVGIRASAVTAVLGLRRSGHQCDRASHNNDFQHF